MSRLLRAPVLLIAFLFPLAGIISAGTATLDGKWELVKDKSTDIDLYGTLSVEIRTEGQNLTLIRTWGIGRSYRDSLTLLPGGPALQVPVTNRVFPSNVFMGFMMSVGSVRDVKAFRNGDQGIRLEESFRLRGSQGEAQVTATNLFTLSPAGETLTYEIKRSTRTSGPPVKFVLKRAGSASGYVIRLEDNWEIAGKIPLQAFMISLQGIAN
ncbi:MAG TPA: hypothetical protein VK569_01245, partial [Bacteroidota bacterium]|nr:hypothetical protein [Bacteroidota bacterium]